MSGKAWPPDWLRVRFGDVVRNVNENVRDPLDNGLERFVGLEHIDPESLHIKRWGLIEEGTTFTRKFVKGQVLFGKRRAYQRKVAVAEFDGICSGDILVFEPANNDLLPELLPFIVQSDGFFEHALGTSAGSLSPRTKWKDLARYEFALPPNDEQRRIAGILWAADKAIVYFEDSINNAQILKRLTLTELTTKGIKSNDQRSTELGMIPAHWEVATVGELLTVCQYGLSIPGKDSGRYPIFRMMNIEDGVVVENGMQYVNLSDKDFATHRLENGDILFNRTNSADLVGKVGIYHLQGNHVFASYLVRLRVRKQMVSPEYLNYYLNSEAGQRRILAYATPGVSQTNINASNLRKVLIPLPPLEEQAEIGSVLRQIDSSKCLLQKQLDQLREIKKQLIARLLHSYVQDR